MPEKPSRSRRLIDVLGHALALEILPAFRLVEQAGDAHHVVIIDGDDHVGVLDVVDPGHVLVANAFDAVRAEAVLQKGRALQRFAGDDLAGGEDLLHVVAAGDRPGGTGGEGHAAVGILRAELGAQHFFHGMPGDVVVPEVVAELIELVEDHQVLAGIAQLPALVEDLFDVRTRCPGWR